jgi:RimJ/RimL family protein N-acetyltransferase
MNKITSNVKIETERLILQKPKKKDWEYVYNNIKKNKDYPKVTRIPQNYNIEMAKQHIKTTMKNFGKENLIFYIKLKETGELIGNMGFNELNHRDNSAMIGYLITSDHRRKGYATEACKALIDFGFKVVELHRIEIGFVKGNKLSQGVINKMGFKYCGLERQAVKTGDGKYHDHLLYDLLAKEWKPSKVKI